MTFLAMSPLPMMSAICAGRYLSTHSESRSARSAAAFAAAASTAVEEEEEDEEEDEEEKDEEEDGKILN